MPLGDGTVMCDSMGVKFLGGVRTNLGMLSSYRSGIFKYNAILTGFILSHRQLAQGSVLSAEYVAHPIEIPLGRSYPSGTNVTCTDIAAGQLKRIVLSAP